MRSFKVDVVLASLVLSLAAWVVVAVVVLSSLAPLAGLVPPPAAGVSQPALAVEVREDAP